MSVIIVTSILAKLGDVSGSVGRSHRSEEVSVMGMGQRASVIWSYYFKQPLKSNGMMKEEKTKSFADLESTMVR